MKPKLWKIASRSLLFYAFDMAIAICGWVYGFGLEVRNWPVLIGLLIFSRWVTHILLSMSMRAEVTSGVKMESDGAK